MASNIISWEQQLLNIAYSALEDRKPVQPLRADRDLLAQAHEYCAEMTQFHSRTFYFASQLLPSEDKKAAQALYAFCRISDDLVDCQSPNQEADFLDWRRRSLNEYPIDDDLVSLAWAHTRARYNIPQKYAEQLLDGVAQDLTINRYKTFSELVHYCYGVASTVGLMTMHIVGYSDNEAIPYAIKLGVALQLTNILRDVGEDWANGRLYLPQDELAEFNLTEDDIANQCLDDRWQAFMCFQIERTRRLYAEAMPGISMLGKKGRFAIAAAADLYQAILEEIEANNYDVFRYRAHTTGRRKLQMLPGIWWRTWTNAYTNQPPILPKESLI
ncbi:MAG: squalene/phytoene synthase family protein [Chloroflexota bacterium]